MKKFILDGLKLNTNSLTIQDLINKLTQFDGNEIVKLSYEEDCYLSGEVCSYRGNYSDLALKFCYKKEKAITVEQLIHVLTNVIGQELQSYRSGKIKMRSDSDVYVAYDEESYSQPYIVDIILLRNEVYLICAY